MHALHSLAHRAPPATRTRVRWQPYSSLSSSSCSSSSSRSSPTSSYLNTPASSVTSSPRIAPLTNEIECARQILPSTTPQSKEPPLRDTHRRKHAVSLVDQAVKSLCEIWRPQDIPPVFVASARTMVTGGATYDQNPLSKQKPISRTTSRNPQLPSPVSPSTNSSPSLASSSPFTQAQAPSLSDQDIAGTSCSRSNLVPIKAFVHEVLRRSRTSGCVLQTALCYLEAIRSKVPELVRQERAGEGVKGEPDLGDVITPATEAEFERETEFTMRLDSVDNDARLDEDVMATVRVQDSGLDSSLDTLMNPPQADEPPLLHHSQRLPPAQSLPSLPPLPSPLLCPRRAFLASLILASKFTQDKCYSNRAWAKLSGLPPREIGRCERALGEALEWRLWVGKQPSAPQTSPPLAPVSRPVVRTQSEASLFTATPTPQPFLVWDEKCKELLTARNPANRGLRRCATLPAEAYAPAAPVAIQLEKAPWQTSKLSTSYINDVPSPGQMTAADLQSSKPMDLSPSTSTSLQYTDGIRLNPSPPTPGLSYSPSSTDSCSGDGTIQMSSFLDDSMGTFACGNPAVGTAESWPWSDTFDITPCLPTVKSPPFRHPHAASKTNPIVDQFGPTPMVDGYADSLPYQVPSGVGADTVGCPWATENGMLMCSLPS
ncbi:putative regulation of cyclin-dependent protein serine/threonine kinase activity [Lyophyllum shimeji]|uniref:Regulation of cyclin-dependent protein serine/threonine kinase activity n=1 Tax=Lyophyllum shimeji TaxID=47721 RepID=A0A9P3PLH4_LYOSH|nr:putative regulation of cyclin-dependent protein serine/threonine kinase activity [Lyophyllum shimeji]